MLIHRYKRRRNLIGLTSLIDVIFLLLLFFMLSSSFTKFTEFSLSTASAGTAKADMEKPIFILALPDGGFDIDGTVIASGELEAHLDNLTADTGKTAILAAKRKMQVQRLVALLERLQQTRLTSVSLAR